MDKKSVSYKNNRRVSTIITNAVCGEATQTFQNTVYIDVDDIVVPTQVLGCTIRNAKIEKSKFEEISKSHMKIRINGEFEIHIWYEENGNTNVAKSYEKFSEIISIPVLAGQEYGSKEILARITKDPVALGTMIINKSDLPTISVQIEYELGVEIVGEARLNILSYFFEKEKKEKTLNIDFDDDYDDAD